MTNNEQTEYVKAWIQNEESKKDSYRIRYLKPYLKKIVKNSKKKEKILDVGCGWGTIISFLKKNQQYVGIDKNPGFFGYIKKEYKNKNIRLTKGSLPNKLKVKANSFDLIICSMVLHYLPNIKKSIKTLISKTKEKGKLIIIDFSDKGKRIKKEFSKEAKEKENYIKGKVKLPSGIQVHAKVHFHKEKEFEKELKKYSKLKKKHLGPLFVAYEITK